MFEIIPFIVSFIIAYVGVPIFGFAMYVVISFFRGTSLWKNVELRRSVSYRIVSRFLPLINLIFWVFAAWIYFSSGGDATVIHALLIGAIWMVVAATLDYIFFILIKQPLSIDRKGFYIDQAPWIYMTYVAVFISPILYAVVAS